MKASLLAGIMTLVVAGACSAAGTFENSTEESTNGWSVVPEKLAKSLIIRQFKADEIARYQHEDRGLPLNLGKALVSKRIPANTDGKPVYFVRPTLAPYYAALYGAHSYWHWLVMDGREVFAASSDGLMLLDSASHGMRDIEERICMTGQCAHTHMQFDGHAYQPVSCRLREVDSGQDVGVCDQLQQPY